MTKSTHKKRKHVPQRTCAGCRTVQPKRSMMRVVRTAAGVQVDSTGKQAGRGAYLHDQRSCWEKAIKGSLANALRCEITPDDRERLLAFMDTLTDQTGAESNPSAQPQDENVG